MTRSADCLGSAALGLLLAMGLLGSPTSIAQTQPEAIALTGARLIDGTGAVPIARSVLVIRDGRIAAVGPEGGVAIPSGATRIDLAGKTVMPGLINAHGHLNDGRAGQPTREQLVDQLRVYADYGVTTVFVLGSGDDDLEESVKLRREQETGSLDRARLYVAGPSIRDLGTAAEAREWVNRYADAGADLVKIHITGGPSDMTPAVYGALIEQAHARGLPVAAHMF
ncbi:MAG TPA: amidohydrolase family protein, partial [Gammaproteobacteria bacterium]|nr:amidohydrolase family protein [Gammaproteobacteria bacterium]